LLGDLVLVNNVVWLAFPQQDQVMNDLQLRCAEVLQCLRTESVSTYCVNVVVYLFGRLSLLRPSALLIGPLVDALTAGSQLEDSALLLEASFCRVVACAQGPQLERLFTKLTSNNSATDAASKLRLIKLLLRYLKDADQIELMASNSRPILYFTLKSLRQSPNGMPLREEAFLGLSLLEELIKRHDIFPVKERDIPLILSYVVSLHEPILSEDSTSREADGGTALYVATAELIATMFQRYTKQLYACAPSLVSALFCLLRHAIYAPSTLPDEQVVLRCQRFTRLCELLTGHKEIYKKHVIGLVLEFVGGLGKSMDFKRRDGIVPAIYFLLDTMSKFEMQQLNAYMDTNAKVLFRTIHQSYEKLHTYKGQ
jgi:Urb2/Npa2 family